MFLRALRAEVIIIDVIVNKYFNIRYRLGTYFKKNSFDIMLIFRTFDIWLADYAKPEHLTFKNNIEANSDFFCDLIGRKYVIYCIA